MYYPDLGNECDVDRGPNIRAIGWLARDVPFSTGQVPKEFVARLRTHLNQPWEPFLLAGHHICELCDQCLNHIPYGSHNAWIPSTACIYVAPELVLHYIETHAYRPPDEFIEAVMRCPEQGSPEFLAQLASLKSCTDFNASDFGLSSYDDAVKD